MAENCVPTPEDIDDFDLDTQTIGKYVNDPTGEPNINRAGDDIGNLNTLNERVLEIAGQYANVYIRQDYAALAPVVPSEIPALGYTLEGDETHPAGFYEYTAANPVWTYRAVQPPSQADLDELRQYVNDFGVSAGTPGLTYFEFHNVYPPDPFFADKKAVAIDGNDRVIGSVTLAGNWQWNGISTGGQTGPITQYEFHNVIGLEGIAAAALDKNNKVFAQFTSNGEAIFIGGGGSAQISTDRFPLDLLNQLLAAVIYGQSLGTGAQGVPVLSLEQPYFNYTFGSGPKSTKAGSVGFNSDPGTATIKPLIEDTLNGDQGEGGNRGETSCSGLANYANVILAANGIDPSDARFLASTAAHGGYTISQLDQFSTWYQVWKDHITEGALRAAEIGKQYIVPALYWIQGESNSSTNLMTYANQLYSLWRAQVEFVKSVTGQTWEPPMLMYQTYSSRTTPDGASQAQLWLARTFPHQFRIVTPVYRLPHVADGTHLINASYKWLGAYLGRALVDILLDRQRVNFIMPGIPIIDNATTIRIPHECGFPLQFDGNTLNRGYTVMDDTQGVTIPIDNVELLPNNDVVLTATMPPDSVIVVTYARVNKDPAMLPINGGTGDLCDTDPTEVVIDDVPRSLRAWCPSFRQTAMAAVI